MSVGAVSNIAPHLSEGGREARAGNLLIQLNIDR